LPPPHLFNALLFKLCLDLEQHFERKSTHLEHHQITLMIRTLLVDDQNIVRQGIQALLEPTAKINVVGTASDAISALEQVEALIPDIVLIDIEMPGISGIVATYKICQKFPNIKVIVLSSHENQEYIVRALNAGAEGYLLKSTLAEDLEQAIWSVYRGYPQLESKLFRNILEKFHLLQLETSVKKNKPDLAEKQELKKTSSNLQSDSSNVLNTNNKCLTEVPKNVLSNKNKSIPKINESSNVSAFQQSESGLNKFQDKNKETSETNNLLTHRLNNKPSVQKNSIKREQQQQTKKGTSLQPWKLWTILLVGIPTLVILTTLIIRLFFASVVPRTKPKPKSALQASSVQAQQIKIKKVAALGRIEPKGGVISLSSPTSVEAVQVKQLSVQVGDQVKKGQIIAILDGEERQKKALDEAKTRYTIARGNLEKVKAGAKLGEIKARKAAVTSLEAELAGEIKTQQENISTLIATLNDNSKKLELNQKLFIQGAIPASELDTIKLAQKTAQGQLNEARAALERTQFTLSAQILEAQSTLEATAEVSPIDIQIAQAELQQAQASVDIAKADTELAYVRAPLDGEILDIHTGPGEALNVEGIAAIGQTEQMMVIAEIDQNDINQVKIGQKAAVITGVLSEELDGKVYQVGSLISKNDILDTDPTADEDSRVVEVEILLDAKGSKKVAKLTNLEVDVIIEL